jgi:hypothetical protein
MSTAMPADICIRHSAVVGSRATKPSVTNAFETAFGSSYQNISGSYEYGAPTPFTSNPFPFLDNSSNINTLSSRLRATSPRRAHGHLHYSSFLKNLHEVHAALSLFVSLPFFIGLETVVNHINLGRNIVLSI